MSQMPCLFVVRNAQQNAEFVAAETGYHVLGAGSTADALGDHLEQLVTRIMAQAVVDALEVVDVQKHHCEHAFGVGVLLQLLGEDLIETAAVDQIGQRVVMRNLLKRDACLIQLGKQCIDPLQIMLLALQFLVGHCCADAAGDDQQGDGRDGKPQL